jgi:alpha-L-rhamnosidase
MEFEDGHKEWIATDESWLSGFGAIVENGLFTGETYDASQALPGWDTPAFDGKGLEPAVLAGEVGELRPQTHPPVVEQERFKAKVIRRIPEENAWIYDFGTNIAGICELKIPRGLPVGTQIRMEFTEELLPDGNLDKETLRAARDTQDVYIVGKENLEIWKPRLTYHGFRFAKITGLNTIPDEDTLVAIAFYNDVKNRSFFRCGDPLVNQLQENIVRTERTIFTIWLRTAPSGMSVWAG